MLTESERIAVGLYPELERLIELRHDRRWLFMPKFTDDGKLDLLAGGRLWSNGWSDGFAVRAPTDARAFRCDPVGGVVWEDDGGLADVINHVLDLPSPGHLLAPHLVRGTASPLRKPW